MLTCSPNRAVTDVFYTPHEPDSTRFRSEMMSALKIMVVFAALIGTTSAAVNKNCTLPNECLMSLTNPQSPLGKQHCQELVNPGGSMSAYWASRGWKYTNPPWKNGTCNRTEFNYVNKHIEDLDGFKGVTFWIFGIQV